MSLITTTPTSTETMATVDSSLSGMMIPFPHGFLTVFIAIQGCVIISKKTSAVKRPH